MTTHKPLPKGLKRSFVFAGFVAMLILGAGSASALAAVPAWKLSSEAAPTNLPPGGTGTILVQVTNVGNANTNGSPITVVDTLPEGLESVQAGEVKEGAGAIANEYWECQGTHVVTCTNNEEKMPVVGPGIGRNASESVETGGAYSKLEAPEIAIRVKVAVGESGQRPNSVHVSGGGARGASDVQPITLSAANAPFGISRFRSFITNEDGTFASQAGAHPSKLTVELSFNSVLAGTAGSPEVFPAAEAKDIHVAVPSGFVGDPQNVAKCSREEFDGPADQEGEPTCPVTSEIGEAVVTLDGGLNLVLPVYNLVPPAGVPAQFGFANLGIYGTLDASLRTGGDYGITENVNNTAERGLLASAVTLWGVPSSHSHDVERRCLTQEHNGEFKGHFGCVSEAPERPFLSNPTSCGKQPPWTVTATSWQTSTPVEVSTEAEEDQGLVQPITGCEALMFNPSITVQPDTTVADSPSGLNVDLHVPQTYNEPEGLATANVKNVTVALPAGMAISPSAANGLAACSPAQIGIENALPVVCPKAAKIGTVEVSTPLLLNPLHGSVYVAQQDENPFGSLLAIYITAEGEGALIKLAGHVEADPVTGQLTTVVDNAPQLPFEDFKLTLFGGERGALVSPPVCGSYSATSEVTPYSSSAPSVFSSPVAITSGCGGGFAPQLNAGSVSNSAGQFTGFTTTLSRADGEQRFSGVQVKLPAGLLGELKSVTPCPEALVVSRGCGPASLIGHSTVAAGPGSDPFWVAGQVFLTGPYKGAPFGLSILTPAVAGPFNLGFVNVRAKLEVDPYTAQVTVVSDPIPTILEGIPLDIRTINVSVDRPGFMFNPTDCAAKTIGSTITSTSGAVASPSVPFQASNCATLAFKPGFSASTAGRASKGGGASLDVKVSYPNGPQGSYANIRSVKVDLPKQLPSRLTTLQKACLAATFEVNPANCPSASDVGTATASTPVLNAPLIGPAYLVSHGGEAFPDLEIVLQGEGITLILDGNTQIKKGITSSTFKTVPDAPVSGFELKLPTGKYSILGANVPQSAHYSLCGQTLSMPTVITAQNGAVIKQTTKISVAGCAKAKKLTSAQQLTKTLKACHKKARGKRAACEQAARKRYAPAKRKKRK